MQIKLDRPLEVEGLRLRELRAADARVFAQAFQSEQALGSLLGWERDPDESALLERIASGPQWAAAGEAIELCIAEADSDRPHGTLTLHSFDWRHRRCEVGFWLMAEARGRGLATRAVARVVTWAFDALGMLRVEIVTTAENPYVDRLALRLGFTREGVLRKRDIERGERVDVIYYGVLREEWRHR